MFNELEIDTLRRAYARQVVFLGDSKNITLEKAFSKVAREDFVGPGPWQIFQFRGRYVPTPDADPAWLYADNLVALIPERGLNNGQPSAHARWINAASPQRGEHVVHIGAGVGYYSAIMADMVGETGSVTAIEYDPELAERARSNLQHLAQVNVLQGDGSQIHFEDADVIYVNAGASRPADIWLNRLKEGGRLILPLTTSVNFTSRFDPSRPTGAVFQMTRHGDEFAAEFVSAIAVFPCEGMRDEESDQALAVAFDRGGYENVGKLVRNADIPGEKYWVKANGWGLVVH